MNQPTEQFAVVRYSVVGLCEPELLRIIAIGLTEADYRILPNAAGVTRAGIMPRVAIVHCVSREAKVPARL